MATKIDARLDMVDQVLTQAKELSVQLRVLEEYQGKDLRQALGQCEETKMKYAKEQSRAKTAKDKQKLKTAQAEISQRMRILQEAIDSGATHGAGGPERGAEDDGGAASERLAHLEEAMRGMTKELREVAGQKSVLEGQLEEARQILEQREEALAVEVAQKGALEKVLQEARHELEALQAAQGEETEANLAESTATLEKQLEMAQQSILIKEMELGTAAKATNETLAPQQSYC